MVLQFRKPQPTFGEILFGGLGSGIGEGLTKRAEAGQNLEIQEDERKRKAQAYKQVIESKEYLDLPMDQKIGLMSILNPEVVKAQQKQQELGQRQPIGGLTGQPVPPQIAKIGGDIVEQNPKATSDELKILLDNAGIPPAYTSTFIENRRRQQERETQERIAKETALGKETLPTKQAIVKRADAAREGLQSKQRLMSLIDSGNLNDPTYAAIADALPLNLGQRMLSEESVQYRAGLIDEFKDLKTIFTGQTRTAELDILQKKVADLYLTDGQKKAILKSRMDALQRDIVIEEAAAEVEDEFPNISALKFSGKVAQAAKPKLQALFHKILDEQKFIIDQADKRRKSPLPLDPSDPNDKEIAAQILMEARGDKNKARKIADKKGYKLG